MSTPTYDPDTTQHKQAAARCGLRLKFNGTHACSVHLVRDDRPNESVWSGSYWASWDYLRDVCGLTAGSH